jgi:curli biogenesis system outer membrane secretion channel CsgG
VTILRFRLSTFASVALRARTSAATVCIAALGARGAGAQVKPAAAPMQRLRVAVADLSGSALKMQSTTTMAPSAPPPAAGAAGVAGVASQTTMSVALPPPAEFARGLTEMLTSVLVKTGRFTVLERSAMANIDAEQALTAAGKVTKETGAQQGGLLGAQAIITGDITGFAYQKTGLGGALSNVVKGLTVSGARVTAEVDIDLRLIDATTGAVLHSAKGVGKADQTGVAADLTRAEKSYSADAQMSTPLGQASRAAIQDAVVGLLTGMPKMKWSGRVIDVRDGVVYVNAVEADGMRAGLELEVFEAQPPLVDPATGQSLGAPERHVGTIVIDAVQEKFSTAHIGSGQGVARGQIIRFKTS